eukprot:2304397-Ditylum_brightwellii.AAC.1
MIHIVHFNEYFINKDSTKHELLLCLTQQPTVNLDSETSAAHPYLHNCSNAHSGVSATDVLLPRTVRQSRKNTTA